MKIVCRYRTTTPRNRVYKLEKLISSCSVTNSEISSMHETETIFTTPKARSDDQIVTTFGLLSPSQTSWTKYKARRYPLNPITINGSN